MVQISDISAKKLRAGQFQQELPELFTLKHCVENNEAHNKQSVFDHSLAVLSELKNILAEIEDKLDSHLGKKFDAHSRKELLLLSALLHDLGKSDTLIIDDEFTSCPDHEEKSANKAQAILDRFHLSNQEKILVTAIIKYHGEIHHIAAPNHNQDQHFKKFKTRHPDIFLELTLLGMADTLGGQLKDNDPKNFRLRINFYRRVLSKLAG